MAAASRQKMVYALYAVSALASLAYFFRHLLIFGLDRVSGDIGDSRIYMVQLEHWREVFLGKRSWSSPTFFYPAANVLGNTDAVFLFSPMFAIFRGLGLDLYLSYDFTLMTVKAIGFASMAWMLRVVLSLPHWACMLGAVLFTIFSASNTRIGHSQLLTIAFVPLIVVGSFRFFQLLPDRPNGAFWYGAMAAAVLGLTLLTSFYIGWYFVLFAICCAAILLLRFWKDILVSRGYWLAVGRRRALLLLALVCIATIFAAPFFILYLPKLAETGGHTYTTLLGYSPNLFDIFHVNETNVIWGRALQRFFAVVYAERPMNGEVVAGFAPLLLAIFFLGLVLTLRQCRGVAMSDRSARDHFIVFAGLTCVILWFMSVRVDALSFWWLIWKFFPGGTAMRVPGRLPIFLAIFVISIAMVGIVRLAERSRLRFGSSAASFTTMLIAIVLVAEQLITRNGAGIDRREEHAILDRIGAPPASCRMFFVTKAFPREGIMDILRDELGPNVDAAILSQKYNVPTFNGMSGWQPRGWDLYNPGTARYRTGVENWIKLHDFRSGICGLDLATGNWSLRE